MKHNKTARTSLTPDLGTLLSAVLIVLSFPPFDLSFLAWVALIPWFYALDRAAGIRQGVIQGIWLSFFMSLGGFHWVASVLHEFGGVPWPLAVVGLILFSLVGQPQFLAFGAFSVWLDQKRRSREALTLFSLAAIYTGLDWLLPKLFLDTLGHSMYLAPRLRQVADLGGAHLISLLVVFTNLALWNLLRALLRREEPSIWPALRATSSSLLLVIAFNASALAYGSYRAREIRSLTENPKARIQGAAVQANIGDFDKVAAERGVRGASEKVLNTYFALSNQALQLDPKPEFLVWPETAYPSTFRTPNTADELMRDQMVEAFVREKKIPLLFGGYDRKDRKDYNALFLLSPFSEPSLSGSEDLQIYRKNVLLLFGEYIPLSDSISFLRNAFPQVGNFGRGSGPEVVSIPSSLMPGRSVKAGPIICYEALFPGYVIDAARKGSELILNITNDSWFGPYGEPYLHLALVSFRSIETRLPQLRSTNTGITALILPDGTITRQTSINQPEILNVSVPVTDPIPTLMKLWGNWFGPFAFLIGIAGIVAVIQPSRKRLILGQ